MRLTSLLMGLILLIAVGKAEASESENVKFHAAVVPPTAFKLRLARERGETIAPEPTTELSGELFRPPGAGPFPAIVWLHSCLGRLHDDEPHIADQFVSQGYALLFVDSFAPRGIKRACAPNYVAVDRLSDAVGALDYLATREFIRSDRIAVVGVGLGGGVALASARDGAVETLSERRFAAAVAYYPVCTDDTFVAPTLVLVGELDEVTPARRCQQMITAQTERGIRTRLAVYTGAYHWFNQRRAANKPEMYQRHWTEYSATADEAALRDISEFLRQHVGR
jgi:dienelactone hydrolase